MSLDEEGDRLPSNGRDETKVAEYSRMGDGRNFSATIASGISNVLHTSQEPPNVPYCKLLASSQTYEGKAVLPRQSLFPTNTIRWFTMPLPANIE